MAHQDDLGRQDVSGGLDDGQIAESIPETEIPRHNSPDVPVKRIIQEVRFPLRNATYSS